MPDDTIEHGIPLPLSWHETRRVPRYHARLSALEVGDSFLVTRAEGHNASSATSLYQKAHPGTKFVRRWLAEGVRIWRVPCPNS